jgi:hypothetical protein
MRNTSAMLVSSARIAVVVGLLAAAADAFQPSGALLRAPGAFFSSRSLLFDSPEWLL